MGSQERTPLLSRPKTLHPERQSHDVYDRFSNAQKSRVLVLVSFCGILPFFVSGAFMPVIGEVEKDLKTTGGVVSLAISISILGASIGALFGASYSTFYGRRPTYLCSLPLFVMGSVGVAFSQSVASLLIWRLLQAIGVSPALAVGAGAVGDIYRLEERGRGMGIFFGAILLGPAIAPVVGGLMANSYSWRIMQLSLAVAGAAILVAIVFLFPETSHPGKRGIDKYQTPSANRIFPIVWLNPFKPLWLLRSPALLFLSLSGTGVLLSEYALLSPLVYTIAARYHIESQTLIGLCYVPMGLGNFIGAPLAGYISDKLIVYHRRRRNGVWVPEDRLRGTLVPTALLVPLSVLAAGLIIERVPGQVGLILSLVCLFVNGLGVDLTLSPSAAYAVDVLHDRSAESLAAINALRSFIIAVLISFLHPLITHVGVAATYSISAVIAWISCGLLWALVKYGEQLRSWVNVGFTQND